MLFLLVTPAWADEPDSESARADFGLGVRHAAEGHWGEALAAFERSHATRPHALTLYNIATCERALGAYTRALATYAAARRRHDATGELPASYLEEIAAKRGEIDHALAHLVVTLDPPDARLAVDGRPLASNDAFPNVLVGGIAAPGIAVVPPSAHFELVLDPGVHVFTIEHKGFATAIVRRELAASSRGNLDLSLTRLPSVIHISANQPGAVVRVDGQDVGVVPLFLSRPAGRHEVEVLYKGFAPYHTTLLVMPGEEPSLSVKMVREPPPVWARWWFWAGIGVIVSGAIAVTTGVYFATRGRAPQDGGGLNWVAPAN